MSLTLVKKASGTVSTPASGKITVFIDGSGVLQGKDDAGTVAALGSGGGGGGAVSSVFGRTGAVVAANNDYTFASLASKPTTVAGYGITDTVTLSGGLVPPANLGSGSSISTKFLRGDNTWQTISGGGDALTSGNLSQFAATTSAQLLGVISDETGTGALVFAGSPTFTGTVNLAAATATGLISTAASASGGAGLRLPHGAAPTSPTNGDVWTTTAGLYARVNGSTVGPFGVGTALTSGNLSQFAATTSGQLLGVISDETGTGVLVFGTNPTLTGFTLAGNANCADFEVQRPLFVDTADKITAHGAMGSTETFDHAASDTHTGTLDADCTFTLSNPSPTGTRCYFSLSITGNGTHKPIFPAAVSFGDLPTPGVIANGVVVTYLLMTDDAGTSYIGSYATTSLTPLNTYTASTTLALTDRDAIMKMNHASSAMNVTFPQNSSVAIPIGASGEIWMYDAGIVTLVQGTGATLKYDSTHFTLVMAGAGSTVSWTKTGTNEFLIRGGLTVV